MDIATVPITKVYKRTGEVLDAALQAGTLYVTDYRRRALVISTAAPEHGAPLELAAATLRNNVRSITERARAGEIFAITRHGRVVLYLWGWRAENQAIAGEK